MCNPVNLICVIAFHVPLYKFSSNLVHMPDSMNPVNFQGKRPKVKVIGNVRLREDFARCVQVLRIRASPESICTPG